MVRLKTGDELPNLFQGANTDLRRLIMSYNRGEISRKTLADKSEEIAWRVRGKGGNQGDGLLYTIRKMVNRLRGTKESLVQIQAALLLEAKLNKNIPLVLGWAWAEACSTLDRGEDPRQTEISGLLDRCVTDLDGELTENVAAEHGAKADELFSQCTGNHDPLWKRALAHSASETAFSTNRWADHDTASVAHKRVIALATDPEDAEVHRRLAQTHHEQAAALRRRSDAVVGVHHMRSTRESVKELTARQVHQNVLDCQHDMQMHSTRYGPATWCNKCKVTPSELRDIEAAVEADEAGSTSRATV